MFSTVHDGYLRIIAALTDIPDCFETIAEIHNLAVRFRYPVITRLLLYEGCLLRVLLGGQAAILEIVIRFILLQIVISGTVSLGF
jgi:hypothetical protein